MQLGLVMLHHTVRSKEEPYGKLVCPFVVTTFHHCPIWLRILLQLGPCCMLMMVKHEISPRQEASRTMIQSAVISVDLSYPVQKSNPESRFCTPEWHPSVGQDMRRWLRKLKNSDDFKTQSNWNSLARQWHRQRRTTPRNSSGCTQGMSFCLYTFPNVKLQPFAKKMFILAFIGEG